MTVMNDRLRRDLEFGACLLALTVAVATPVLLGWLRDRAAR